MKVRALKTIAPGSGLYGPGSVFELPDEQAKNLIAAGAVERVYEGGAVEAQAPPPAARPARGRDRSVPRPPADRMQRGRRSKRRR